jgi:hypothetical protein
MQNDQLLSGVLPAAAPTQPVIVQQNPPATVDYTLGMSPVMRMFAQFGFAGLAAVLVESATLRTLVLLKTEKQSVDVVSRVELNGDQKQKNDLKLKPLPTHQWLHP